MGTVQYRVEPNPLTKPASYKLRFIPHKTAGYDDLAVVVANDNGLTFEQAKACIQSTMRNIKNMLGNGIQVTLEDALIFAPSFRARLNSPDDPLPPIEELLRISVSATRPFIQDVQQLVTLARVATEEKAPTIISAADTMLELNNVLNPDGVLRLTGSNLLFDPKKPNCECLIKGTRNGKRTQSQFASIRDGEILLVPHIQAQSDPWNNEYTVSVSTQYTEHGSVRTGTYGQKLRTPLTVDLSSAGESGVGILTGSADTPHVWLTARAGSGAERLRIQVDSSVQEDMLAFRLIALQDGGAVGGMVPVTANGEFTLPGFAGSAVSSLHIIVSDYAALRAMIRNDYDGRLVDILDVVG